MSAELIWIIVRHCVQRIWIVVLLALLTPFCVSVSMAQKQTAVTGRVIDANNNETLPFVQVLFEGTSVGTTTDLDGDFAIADTRGNLVVTFRMVGYKTKRMSLKPGKTNNLHVVLEPEVYALEDVVIKPQKKREHYRRKGNPAVDLIKNVIAAKDRNRLGKNENFKMRSYEKLVMALDPFDYNLDKNAFWRDFKFLEHYVDTMIMEDGVLKVDSGIVRVDSISIGEDSTFVRVDSVVLRRDTAVAKKNRTPILTLSIRETLADEYNQVYPRRERKVITAKRWEGFDDVLSNPGMASSLEAMFQPINIFANDINLMLNRFVSPLSSSLAVSYYHYYIMDTIMIDTTQCIDLAFVPVNSESFGFTGHLYIAHDGSYALKRYKINVPPKINLNWLSHLSIEETFDKLDNGKWISRQVDTHARFAIRKKSKHNIYARQTRYFDKYELGIKIPEKMFYMTGATITQEGANKVKRSAWDTLRPIALTDKETLVDSLDAELMKVPKFRFLKNTLDDLINEYIPTSRERNKSKWDFGPIFHVISYNEQEGVRLRAGGMTTANQNPNWFTSHYVAYGFTDKRVKGGITALYSFNKKDYHPYQSLRHYLSLTLSYDLEELGQSYRVLDRDHIFMSIKFNYKAKPMMYVTRARLKYEKEWANQLSLLTWVEAMNCQPNGSSGAGNDRWAAPRFDRSPLTMSFIKRNADGTILGETPFYHDYQWVFQLRYSPGGFIYNDRQGIESPFNLWKDAPVFRFTNEMGFISEDKYFYNRIQFTAEKRFWLSAFGHIDISADMGYIAAKKVPFTKLFIPMSNQSILMDPKAFSLMQPMEFLMDRYVSCHITYYMKGWLFNRIPGIRKLKLREIVSFHALAGYLGDRNNPYKTDGLYEFPYSYYPKGSDTPVRAKTTFADGKYNYMPYMEITAGIENIFKLIRIEYVRRLTHIQGLSAWQKNSIRITLRVAM